MKNLIVTKFVCCAVGAFDYDSGIFCALGLSQPGTSEPPGLLHWFSGCVPRAFETLIYEVLWSLFGDGTLSSGGGLWGRQRTSTSIPLSGGRD